MGAHVGLYLFARYRLKYQSSSRSLTQDTSTIYIVFYLLLLQNAGAQWLIGRVLDSRPKGSGFEPHRRHCIVSLRHIYPSLVLVQLKKTRSFITERLLMGRKESNQTKQTMDYPKFIVSNQKEESISIQKDKLVYLSERIEMRKLWLRY